MDLPEVQILCVHKAAKIAMIDKHKKLCICNFLNSISLFWKLWQLLIAHY